MTTAKPTTDTAAGAAASKTVVPFRLPDPPEHPDDKMTNFKQLSATGHAHHLVMHLGNPETTLVTGERYVVLRPTRSMAGSHYPDLLVAFGVDPALYEANNGYIISEQNKPPDFVLEIASRHTGPDAYPLRTTCHCERSVAISSPEGSSLNSARSPRRFAPRDDKLGTREHTGHIDVGEKRDAYAAIGILEYWRFDETRRYHGARLASDRLEDGRYVPIDIDELSSEVLQGYSVALNLLLRWDNGTLGWHDPDTGLHIATFTSERLRADREQARRIEAEAQVRALQEQLRQLRGD